ncbi:MAG: histidine kinase dimerization/phospho-acceptor domain-containing protein [Ginsengibacter sp.]
MTPEHKIKNVQKSNTAQIFELKSALAYAQGIVDTVREPLIVLYPKLTISSVNKAFYKAFKTTAKGTIGKHIYDIGDRQFDIPLLKKLLEKILIQKNSFDNFEVENNFKDIGHRVMLLNARKLKIADKDDQMILLAIQDITEKKVLEKKVEIEKDTLAENEHLIELAKQKDDFMAIASHELRTPITTLKVCTHILEMEFANGSYTHALDMLTKMNTQMDNLVYLIAHLLDNTKMQDGKLQVINSTLN